MLRVLINDSIRKTIHGINAKARISGLKTSLIEIEGGKKLRNMKVTNITLFENFKNFNSL